MLLNVKKQQRPDVNNIYFYVKDPFKSKYQLLITRREKVGIKELRISKEFIDYSQPIDVYKNSEDYNPTKKRKVLVVFDDLIADMEAYRKLSPIIN